MNPQIKLQKLSLQMALSSLNTIEKCDENIKIGNHASYFKTVRQDAVLSYSDAIAEIIESSIDLAVDFEKRKPFDQRLLDEINTITLDYKRTNGIA